MNKNFLRYLKFCCAVVFAVVLIFSIFSVYHGVKYSYIKKWCTESNLKNLTISEIKEKFRNYPFWEDKNYGKFERNNDKIRGIGFKITNNPFDFIKCFVSYDQETGKLNEVGFIKD